jgi:hypothetical protein
VLARHKAAPGKRALVRRAPVALQKEFIAFTPAQSAGRPNSFRHA